MSREAEDNRLKKLQNAIETYPGNRPGFFARLLGWRREEVNRSLARFTRRGTLLYEDDDGGLWPFDPDAVLEKP